MGFRFRAFQAIFLILLTHPSVRVYSTAKIRHMLLCSLFQDALHNDS